MKISSFFFQIILSIQDFQQRLQQLDTEVIKLHERAKRLNTHLSPIAAKKIDTQYSVINNQYIELQNFQHKLLTDCDELKHREKIYLAYLNELTQTIHQVQTTLKSQQLTAENEIHNLKQLHELDILLQSKHDLIERLNSNEFILYIKRARHLHELMIEYSQCVDLVKMRLKQIETSEYSHLNFDRRCQKWNDYIQAIEKKLFVIQENLPTNYHGLIEIDKNLSNITNDFSQRQQELIQLINEGKQVVENSSSFTRLEQRWQTMMNAVIKKHEEVKELIKLWLSYQTYLESTDLVFYHKFFLYYSFLSLGYYRLLKGKCEIQQQELQTASISKINEIKRGSYVTSVKNDELKNLLEKIYETNRRLIKHSDAKTQIILEKEWNDLQKSIQEIEANVKQKCDTLVKVRCSNFFWCNEKFSLDLIYNVKGYRSAQVNKSRKMERFFFH